MVSGFLKFCGPVAVVVSSLWFISSCGAAGSGEACVPGRIKPGMVCADEGRVEHTYAQMRAAKERGRERTAVGGAAVVVGVGLTVLGGAFSRASRGRI
ncbi:hypothetical protein ACFY8C_40000 [Streptomyces flavochromogenes]|uniref:Lipoprotein n=2 Tax=Streptomyces flavochromogenes TaxID=68199 RepID=A0ABW6Y3V2_9ACTN